MGKIRLMPDDLASQVAAGEVVERPASVVKELVENSLDAQAKRVEVAVERGGAGRIRVIDDGSGMERGDALLSVERHATSKLRSKEDLARIATFGFRGEALPSVASVSKFTLQTRERNALSGTEIIINGGKMSAVKDCGCAPGTLIEARSLFFNMPARRKFLRAEATEFAHIERALRVQAIAQPEVAFSLTHNGRERFRLPAAKDRLERIRGLVGADVAEHLVDIKRVEREGVTLSGFAGEPGLGRTDSSLTLVYLNGRPIESPILYRALQEAYHGALMKGRKPTLFLFLEMDPAAADINVHPAKREARFRDGFAVRRAVAEVVGNAIRTGAERVYGLRRDLGGESGGGSGAPTRAPNWPVRPNATVRGKPSRFAPAFEQEKIRPALDFSVKKIAQEGSLGMEMKVGAVSSAAGSPTDKLADGEHKAPQAPNSENEDKGQIEGLFEAPDPEQRTLPKDFRYIGVFARLYLMFERPDGLALMDQHAAHERVLFEKVLAEKERQGVRSQPLLEPLVLKLQPIDFTLLSRHMEALQGMGVSAEPFGDNTLKIDALPALARVKDPRKLLDSALVELRRLGAAAPPGRLIEDAVAMAVCRAAIKANDPLKSLEAEALLRDLLRCDMPFCCPHGRPTLILLTHAELEKRFGRRAE